MRRVEQCSTGTLEKRGQRRWPSPGALGHFGQVGREPPLAPGDPERGGTAQLPTARIRGSSTGLPA